MESKCAFCGAEIKVDDPWMGPKSGKPYCPDRLIDECLKEFAARVEYTDYSYKTT